MLMRFSVLQARLVHPTLKVLSALKASLVAAAFLTASVNAQAPLDVRVALVIGNAAYAGNFALTNPANDAAAMSALLKTMGFSVIEVKDGSRAQMEDAMKKAFNNLKGKQGIGMLYYAGHGLQVDWKNYMLPVDAKLQSAKDVAAQTLDVADVLDAFKAAGSRMNIIVLDACRDNPFADKGAKGLAPVDAPTGTFLAYATAPGNVAEDGAGSNGLYTKHLLAELQKPVSIENVFKRVRFAVRKESNGRQIPWESTSLEDDFSFAANKVVASVSTGAQRDADFAQQKAEWDKIKNTTDAEEVYQFLTKYPSGLLSEIAQFKVNQLSGGVNLISQGGKGQVAQQEISDRLSIGDEWVVAQRDVSDRGFFLSWDIKDTYTYKAVEKNDDLLKVTRGLSATLFFTNSGAEGGGDQPMIPSIRYDPPVPMIPTGPFKVGYKASSRSSVVRSGKNEGIFDAELAVVARESITTRMGTFDAYKIIVKTKSINSLLGGPLTETIITSWYEPGAAIPLKKILEIPELKRTITQETVTIKRANKS